MSPAGFGRLLVEIESDLDICLKQISLKQLHQYDSDTTVHAYLKQAVCFLVPEPHL